MAQRLTPTIPFIEPLDQRGTGTGDARYVNVTYERDANQATKEQAIYCQKRWGLNLHISTSTSGAGRGIHAWQRTGSIYSVVGNSVFLDTSTLFSSMNTSTGKCWFLEIPQSTGNENLIICDGQDDYDITSTGVITQIDQADTSNYPVSNLGPLAYLDGYVFRGQSNGRIWNTTLNTVTSWKADAYTTADSAAGELEAIHIQKDQIIGLTKNRIEFFFNNGNPSGSPLLKIKQNIIQVGIASKETLASAGEAACFVGESSGDGIGGRAVYLIASQRMKDISTPAENRLLTAEGKSLSSATSWMETINGQLLYGLTLPLAGRTLVWNIDQGFPAVEWQSSSGAFFRGVSATSLNGKVYFQDQNNGNVYVASVSTYQDFGSNFFLTLQTKRFTHGTDNTKYQSELRLIADRTSGTVSTYTSDDDYQTTTFIGNIDMTKDRKYLTRLGKFYERSYTFRYGDNSSFRAQAFIPDLEIGKK